MGKNIEIQYNGEIGYLATIEDVVLNVFKIYAIKATEFLDYKADENTLSNREIIFQNYTIQEKINLGLADEEGNDLKTADDISPSDICPYVTLYIDCDYVNKNKILSSSSVLVDDFSVNDLSIENGAFSAFLNKNKFFKDYISKTKTVDKEISGENFSKNLHLKKQQLKPKVWIWCKSLNEDQKFNPNSLFDLSPFIESIETTISQTGGNFSLKLLPIEGFIKIDENGEAYGYWSPKKDNYVKFEKNNDLNYLFKNHINARFSSKSSNVPDSKYIQKDTGELNQAENYIVKRGGRGDISSDLFFKNLISANDVIFISFNEFSRVTAIDDFFISNENLPGKDWNMIGLVDKNQSSLSYESSEIGVNISGRDCMKLLIEDGSYFFPKSYSNENENSIFKNVNLPDSGDDINTMNKRVDSEHKGVNRLVTSGMLESLFTTEARNINFVMNLLISTLANVEICPSELFEHYGDKVTKFQIPIYETVKESGELTEEEQSEMDDDIIGNQEQ
ncbi:MAG: hypothetical protein ABIN48_01945 [Ginsengibacter sp.]